MIIFQQATCRLNAFKYMIINLKIIIPFKKPLNFDRQKGII